MFSDALNHASIIDGIGLSKHGKVIYPHRDLNSLEDGLARHEHEARLQGDHHAKASSAWRATCAHLKNSCCLPEFTMRSSW